MIAKRHMLFVTDLLEGDHGQIISQTFAPTHNMTNRRLFFALAAIVNMLVFSTVDFNAFAEAHAPAQVFLWK